MDHFPSLYGCDFRVAIKRQFHRCAKESHEVICWDTWRGLVRIDLPRVLYVPSCRYGGKLTGMTGLKHVGGAIRRVGHVVD